MTSGVDHYDLGAADELDELDVGMGALVVTPGAMLDEMRTVDALIRQIEIDVKASSVRQAFKDAFASFREEWRKFYAEHESWWGRMWGAVYEKILDFRRRAEEWRQAFLREGGNTAVPSVAPPGEKPAISNAYLWLVGAGIGAWALASVASMRK
jgi:hypothetical protein